MQTLDKILADLRCQLNTRETDLQMYTQTKTAGQVIEEQRIEIKRLWSLLEGYCSCENSGTCKVCFELGKGRCA